MVAKAGGIFVTYRRDDAKHAAGRLVDRLVAGVGRDKLFMDVDNIEPGLDFVKVLNDQVAKCDVLLALIGPNWLDSRDQRGDRRLDNPGDFVRIEIEAALARDIRVVPVLLDGAGMPAIDALPQSLQPLLRRQAVRISHERFAPEADALAGAMKRALGVVDPPPALPPAPDQITISKSVRWGAPVAKPSIPVGGSAQQIASTVNGIPAVVAVAFVVAAVSLEMATMVDPIAGAVSALIAVALATTVVQWRGNALMADELGAYWLGSVLAWMLFILGNFTFLGPGDVGLLSGLLVGLVGATLSGLLVRRWWKRRQG